MAQTAKPEPVFMATTPATLHAPPAPPAAPPTTAPSPAAPQPTSILVLDTSSKKPHPSKSKKKPKKPKPPRETWHIPVLRLELHDLAHAGTQRFLTAGLDLSTLLKTAVTAVLSRLYASPAAQPAKVKTLKLVVRAMDTLAYTTGTARAKEIHLSSSYLAQLTLTGQALADEILGVVRHEMVHVWQHNGRGAAPGGLVEGIADWVRMRDGLVPAHWSRGGRRWDEGYQVTAYFLEWLEDCYGEGTMRAVNEGMKGGYDEEALWAGVSGGKTVGTLWGEYCEAFGIEVPGDGEDGSDDGSSGSGEEGDSSDGSDSDDDGELVAIPATPSLIAAKKSVYIASDHSEAAATRGTRPGSALSITTTSSAAAASSSDAWPFTGEQALTTLMQSRLQSLTYDGTTDGRRFVREFEALVDRVAPDMSDADKRLLLVTALRGEKVVRWYEEWDLEDEVPYGALAEEVARRWRGGSGREARRVEREAKMD